MLWYKKQIYESRHVWSVNVALTQIYINDADVTFSREKLRNELQNLYHSPNVKKKGKVVPVLSLSTTP
jgi:hypothetical protein